MKYKVVDLFAGIGGMTKAFTEAGLQVIWANDFDKSACKIYRFNNVDVELVQNDITQINLATIPDFDILTASFPMQSFSITAYKNDYNNNSLLNHIFNVLKAKQPKAFLLESIKGILTHDRGRTIKLIIEELESLGYKVTFKILNAKDYGNIPHNKEKLFIVGFKSEKCFEDFSFPEPVVLNKSVYEIVNINDRKEDIYYINKSVKCYNFLKENVREKFMFYKKVICKYPEFKKMGTQVCPTLSSRGIDYFILDDYGVRNLTIEEYLEFHGLYNYKIPNNISKSKSYQLIANSSTVPIIRRIAFNICDVLNTIEFSSNRQNTNERNGQGTISEIDFVNEKKSVDKVNNISGTKLKSSKEETIKKTAGYYENDFESLLNEVEKEDNIQKKGKALELLIKKFFEQIEGFEVGTNIRTETEEIDICITNKSQTKPWIDESFIIVGECKNWSKSCGKNEFVIFKEKLENRNARVTLGFFISWNGFASTFTKEALRNSKSKTLIVPIEGRQIKEGIMSGEIEIFLEKLYTKAMLI